MTKIVDAVYENGFLKPLEPLDLAEQQRVSVTISDTRSETGVIWPLMEAGEQARLRTLDEVFDEIDRANLQLRVRMPTREELYDRC